MVYSEEIIDRKIVTTKRSFNENLGIVEFRTERSPVFQTVPGERVVFQIGTNDATRALRGAEMVARDVCAIDVNMGCPKKFSVSGG